MRDSSVRFQTSQIEHDRDSIKTTRQKHKAKLATVALSRPTPNDPQTPRVDAAATRDETDAHDEDAPLCPSLVVCARCLQSCCHCCWRRREHLEGRREVSGRDRGDREGSCRGCIMGAAVPPRSVDAHRRGVAPALLLLVLLLLLATVPRSAASSSASPSSSPDCRSLLRSFEELSASHEAAAAQVAQVAPASAAADDAMVFFLHVPR